MKLFNRAQSATEAESSDTEEADAATEQTTVRSGHTPGKGRPTPKRSQAQGRRGPVPRAPATQREASKRAKALRGTKEDRREQAAERRRGMEAGDDRYVLPRDRGPVRAYVRDLVDAKRNLAGLFMPLALVILASLFTPTRSIQQYALLVVTAFLALMIIEGIVNGMALTKKVRAKFPKATDRGMQIGWYAFVRSTQIRRLRMPKPKVKPGAKIA